MIKKIINKALKFLNMLIIVYLWILALPLIIICKILGKIFR